LQIFLKMRSIITKMNRQKNQSGFGIIGIILVVVVVAVLVLGGWVIAHHAKKTSAGDATQTSGSTSTTTKTQSHSNAVTSDELFAVAKQVYFQTAADGSNPPGVGTCEKQNVNSCPFTADLVSKISNAQVRPSDGPTLIAGAQNGPFGTVAYSATPTSKGGTVTVTATPDASVGGGLVTWELTIVQDSGKLLVSDIQYSKAAFSNTKACGPIEIYEYPTCYQ
jgi:Tfp pilus assembly protein PilV